MKIRIGDKVAIFNESPLACGLDYVVTPGTIDCPQIDGKEIECGDCPLCIDNLPKEFVDLYIITARQDLLDYLRKIEVKNA